MAFTVAGLYFAVQGLRLRARGSNFVVGLGFRYVERDSGFGARGLGFALRMLSDGCWL